MRKKRRNEKWKVTIYLLGIKRGRNCMRNGVARRVQTAMHTGDKLTGLRKKILPRDLIIVQEYIYQLQRTTINIKILKKEIKE